MHVVSVNVKLPPAGGGTAIDKQPAAGPVAVTADGLEGDGVGDTEHHGGPDQAVYAYGTADYTWWAHELGRSLPPGTFGENLTIDGPRERPAQRRRPAAGRRGHVRGDVAADPVRHARGPDGRRPASSAGSATPAGPASTCAC